MERTRILLISIWVLQCYFLVAEVDACRPSNSSGSGLSLGGRGFMNRLMQQMGLDKNQADSMMAARAFPGLGGPDSSPPTPSSSDQQPPRRRGWGGGWGRRRQQQQQQPDALSQAKNSGMDVDKFKELVAKYGMDGAGGGSRRRRQSPDEPPPSDEDDDDNNQRRRRRRRRR